MRPKVLSGESPKSHQACEQRQSSRTSRRDDDENARPAQDGAETQARGACQKEAAGHGGDLLLVPLLQLMLPPPTLLLRMTMMMMMMMLQCRNAAML